MGSDQIFSKAVAKHNAHKYAEAIKLYKMVLMKCPMHLDANYLLGTIYAEIGKYDDAKRYLLRAEKIMPNSPFIKVNLGIVHKGQGDHETALNCFLHALELHPDLPEAHCNLGKTLNDFGRLDEAESSYRRALEIKPDFLEVLNNLALLLNKQGQSIMALDIIRRSLQIQETGEAKNVFISCLKRLSFRQDDSEMREIMVRALTVPWGRPSELEKVCIDLVKSNPEMVCITRAVDAWPLRLSAQALFGVSSPIKAAADQLLCVLLNSAPICDIEMERFLTMARNALLDVALEPNDAENDVGTVSRFYTALACQCFINEYVFSYTDDEIQKADHLRGQLVAALEARAQPPLLWIVAVAAYFPLGSLPFAARLLESHWPEEVTAVLIQQVREPLEELHLRTTIPRLTSIQDEVTLLVQHQYEENPYPRWVKVPQDEHPKNINVHISQLFPLTPFTRYEGSGNIDVLIAGCGTGQHSLESARRFLGAKVLAVDLSMDSLCYAKRKTLELGVKSIEYAQADLTKLGSLGRSFDVIESCGVLHHLANPWAGWQVLLTLLRPGGFMRIGLYSELARRDIVRTRSHIAARGYGSTAADIRRCRQDLLSLGTSTDCGAVLQRSDFFSTSNCRDLLFHVQEQRMTLTGIATFLFENNLAFLGFEIRQDDLHAYKQRFPEDHPATNLANWQFFENENPETFAGMYQFWIQKKV